MNITNLKKIQDLDKLRDRIEPLKKEARFFSSRVAKSTTGSKKNKGYTRKLEETMEKLRYINTQVPVAKLEHTTYPVIIKMTRESGYSARALGVSARQLREHEVAEGACELLSVEVKEMVAKGDSPEQIKNYVEAEYYNA